MKILIIGSGGREHALAVTYAKSKRVTKIFVAPGNDFMMESSNKIQTLAEIDSLDFEKIVAFAKKQKIDLVDVAPDEPLAAGLVDVLKLEGIKTFGPDQGAASIEYDKIWARNFMKKYKLPTPSYQYFTSQQEAVKYVQALPEQVWYVKASGLAAGKGVIRAETKEATERAILSMKRFGKSGRRFLIEEAMIGEEFSLFAICDGRNYRILQAAQDHKTVFNKDLGPNTGGMGCVSPITLITPSIIRIIEQKILKPFMNGMIKEGRPYTGILYLGGMVTKKGVQIIEFNARWGDPEAQVILPGIKTDYIDIINAVTMQQPSSPQGGLSNATINVDKKVRISIAGCAKGYPEDYTSVKDKIISGIEEAMRMPGIKIFGAGIKKVRGKFVVNGGRVFHLVAEGTTIHQARDRAHKAMKLIKIKGNNLHYRTDIGWRELKRISN